MKKFFNTQLFNLIGILCMLCGAGVLLRAACLINAQDIWFDELFTVSLAAKPIPELLSLAAQDVHPPLYYIYVRGVYLVMHAFSGSVTVVTAAKAAALIPYVGVIICALVYIRREFGWISAGLTVLLVETMPQLAQYMTEARMYSAALFTVMAMFIHGYFSLKPGMSKKKAYIHLAAAGVYGIISMYLHYYAFMGAGAVLVCMLVISALKRRKAADRGTVSPAAVLVCGGVCLAAYIPWVKTVLGQVSRVSADYWIQPVSLRTPAGCLKYIFRPDFAGSAVSWLCAFVLAAAYAGMLVLACVRMAGKKKTGTQLQDEDSAKTAFFISSAVVLLLLVLAGIIASVVIRPVFVYRYMVPVLGVFWMGYACLAGYTAQKVLIPEKAAVSGGLMMRCLKWACAAILAVTVTCTAVRDFNLYRWEEQKKVSGMEVSGETFEMIRNEYPETLIVCNFNQVQDILWYYLDNASVLWGETGETLIADICGRSPVIMTSDAEELKKLAGDDGFLFVGSGNAREDIISDWESQGFSVEEIADSCLVERYYFNIYRVEY